MSATTVPKKFLNDPTHAVSEYISGLLLQYPTKLQKLPHHNVLLSTNIRLDRVNILSGGGSGHEPSHAGWIGEGMLTGAILGGIFASPSVSSILAAIRAVTIPNPSRSKQEESEIGRSGRGGGEEEIGGGCLLIVKNYTGDRLNFGMATEIARGEGRNVRMVIVADDTALERQKGVKGGGGGGGGARGVAGTVLVHKVAGAAAKRGYDLDRVAEIATCMARSVRSLGVALNAVTIPGAVVVNDRLMASGGSSSSMIEIGMGIHGEAGRLQSLLKSADELASIMIRTICEYGVEMEGEEEEEKEGRAVVVPTFERGEELCVVVNNLGGTSNFEMGILANSVVSQLENEVGVGMGVDVGMGGWGCWVSRLYVGSFMTSFDMQGASVSIVSLSKVKRHLRELLDDDTDAPAWQKSDVVLKEGTSRKRMVEENVSTSTVLEISSPITTEEVTKCDIPVVLGFGSNVLEKAVSAACNRLIESEPILTKYDTIVGDGDCGITMERGAKEILSRLESKVIDTSHPVVFFEHLAVAISSSMGGTSGILLEIMCRKMSTTLKAQTLIDGDAMRNAFEQGVKAVSFYGGATLGSRTMLDALLPAVEVMKSSPCDNLTDVAKAASEGALATAFMSKASAGRSNYLSEDTLRGTPDPGAIAVGLVLSAISTVLSF